MAPRRWLWPCSDSLVLRLPAYQKPSLHTCLIHPEHPDQVLVDDSDDDLDDDLRAAKRRRIESIAHAFLNGQPIYIPSARLKGPFPADRDLSLCHDPLSSPDAQPVSPPPTVTAGSFIRRRPEHPRPESPSPEPALTPSRLHSSPAVPEKPATRSQSTRQPSRSLKDKSLRSDLQSSAVSAPSTVLPPLPKSVAINKASLQDRDTSDKLPTSKASSRSKPSPIVRIPDTSFISPSPSPAKDEISPSKAAVLRQRPASSLNKVDKAPSSTRMLASVKKNKRPTKRVYQAAAAFDTTSPFIYRKNVAQARKINTPAKEKSVEQNDVPAEPSATSRQSRTPVLPTKRHHILFQSSLDVPDPKSLHALSVAVEPEHSPESIRHDFVPAINMSFGQESFGMDFNVINHYNASLPAPSTERRKSDANTRDQEPSTPTVDPNPDIETNPHSNGNAQLRETEAKEARPGNANQGEPVKDAFTLCANGEDRVILLPTEQASPQITADPLDQPMEDTVLDDMVDVEEESADELPYISTQAAIQDAHRALFDASSPLQRQEETFELPFETPAKQVTSPPSSPVHTITPFHQFNAELTTDTQAPLPNTQALFNGFYSPIKLSAKKPRTVKRTSFAPSVILEDADDTVASDFDVSDDAVVRENSQDRTDLERKERSAISDQDPSSIHDILNPALLRAQKNPTPSQDMARLPSPQSPASRSDSPDFILSQKTLASTRESVGHVLPSLQQDSIPLSEVLNFVSSRRGIEIGTLLSQNTPTSSSRSVDKKTQKSARSSQAKSQSSLPKSRLSRSRRPRSSLTKSISERKVGERRSTRLSLSQPNPQTDGADDDYDTEVDINGPPATQPHLTFAGSGRSFASVSFTIPDGSSTIPDPSLAFNHAQQNATPASEKPAFTPGSAPQSTGSMSSFQHAQKQYSSLTDLDSTMPDLPQTFLPPVR